MPGTVKLPSWALADSGPLIGLRVSISRNPWRIGPAWAVLAGAIAAGAPFDSSIALLRVAGGVVLADCAWGAVWAALPGEPAEDRPALGWSLPYSGDDAPIRRIVAGLSRLNPSSGCLESAASIGLAVGLAALLGALPLVLSAAVVTVALVSQALAVQGPYPALGHALLAFALPWCLGLALSWHMGASLMQPLILGGTFTLLQWGAQRARQSSTAGIWLGEVAVLVAMVGLRLPWAVCAASVLMLPASWWVQRGSILRAEQRPAATSIMRAALSRSQVWWWAVLFLAALALRPLSNI